MPLVASIWEHVHPLSPSERCEDGNGCFSHPVSLVPSMPPGLSEGSVPTSL